MLCVHVRMYVCMCCVCAGTCVYMCVSTYACVYVCVRVCVRVCVCVCVRVHIIIIIYYACACVTMCCVRLIPVLGKTVLFNSHITGGEF